MEGTHQSIDTLITKVKTYLPTVHERKLREAYEFAERAHAGQTRMSGEPYITHPLGVAFILTDFKADEESISVALLHDVVEDCNIPVIELEKLFGKEVSHMVDALTKLPRAHLHQHEELPAHLGKIESIRKVFEVMEDDVRIIVIKLCDRLHNMQSLEHFRPDKQKRIAQETFDIYVKIADRLSIGLLKNQLAELSFRYLYPEQYKTLKHLEEKASLPFQKKEKLISDKISGMKHLKNVLHIFFQQEIAFAKLLKLGIQEPEIAFRMILIFPDVKDCYLGLHDVHSLWKNISGTFRDYITSPKSNGFKALRSHIVEQDGAVIKITLQTKPMYLYALYGISLECFSGNSEAKKITLPWINGLKRIHRDTKERTGEYLRALEQDVLSGSIIVYLPENETLFLPPRCTALDAAYTHLAENAHHLRGILINQKLARLSQPLKEGDNIQFQLGQERAVRPAWIQFVYTAYAKSHIYEYMKQLPDEDKTQIGIEALQQELDQIGFGYLEEISLQKKHEVAKLFERKSWKDTLISIAEGAIPSHLVLAAILKREEIFQRSYTAQLIVRRSGSWDEMIKLFHYLKKNSIDFVHLSTKRSGKGYIDRIQVTWSLLQRNIIFFHIKEHFVLDVIELKNFQKGILPLLAFFAIPFFWAINTFFSRYFMQEGMTSANATEIRFLSSAVILFLIARFVKYKYREEYAGLKFSMLFYFVTFVLTIYTYLIHLSLYYTTSMNYIIPVSISFVLIGLIHALAKPFLQQKNIVQSISVSFFVLFSMIFLFQQENNSLDLYGILLGIIVFILHMTYNYFGNRYQQRYKVKSRGVILLSSMFFIASILFLPFVNFQNLIALSPKLIFIAVLNGVMTGGFAHFLFFELTKFHLHYKMSAAMSLMVLFTILIGYFWGDVIDVNILLSAFLMMSAMLLSSWYEYRKQGAMDSLRNLV